MTPHEERHETRPADPVEGAADTGTLLPDKAATDFQSRWEDIQHSFVDAPRDSITRADALVGEVMQQLSETFDVQRRALEGQWSAGEPSTEELRTAFQRYRVFFDRLLNV